MQINASSAPDYNVVVFFSPHRLTICFLPSFYVDTILVWRTHHKQALGMDRVSGETDGESSRQTEADEESALSDGGKNRKIYAVLG